MILLDTSPLVALIDRSDHHHAACNTALAALGDEAMLTTWPCLTEALYLLGRAGGYPVQEAVWNWVAQGFVQIDLPTPGEWLRMRELMRKYADVPMDLADASLVAVAERLSVSRVFTLDSHFRVYRLHGTGWFDVIP